jgi:hypothetical protein
MGSLYTLVLVIAGMSNGQEITNMVTITDFRDKATCEREIDALVRTLPDGFVVDFRECISQPVGA